MLISDNVLLTKQDLHSHSTFSDGANTPEEMVLSAIDKGLVRYGISTHSFIPFDQRCCIKLENYPVYKAEMARLKEKYSDKIEILCGIEQEYLSPLLTDGFDYVIGSVHFLNTPAGPILVDETAEILRNACNDHFGGDPYAMAESYFDTVADVVNRTHCDIIGHFDLITKYNEVDPLFDIGHPRYVAAYRKAVDALIPYGVPFEINTGAISRGYRTSPYPAKPIADYIKARGGRFVLSSDSHSAGAIALQFDKWAEYYEM